MSGAAPAGLMPTLLILVILACDVWVYFDAKSFADREMPVVLTLGAFRLESPVAWAIGCLLLWIVFCPLYLVARGRWE
jgi:hypothetical protein